MKVNKINCYQNFKGIMMMNKRQVAKNIANSPNEIQQPLIDNIALLKSNIRQYTPASKKYNFELTLQKDYIEQDKKPSSLWVSLYDEYGNSTSQRLNLNSESNNPYRTIWQDGFSYIAGQTIDKSYKTDLEEKITPIETKRHLKPIQERNPNLATMRSYIDFWELKGSTIEERREFWQKAEAEIQAISDSIEDRDERIFLDKEAISKTIYYASRKQPPEIKDSLIQNLNEFTKNIEEKTSPEKEYGISMSIDGFNYVSAKVENLDEEFIEDDTHENEMEFINPNPSDISEKLFNPLSDSVCEKGFSYLPFENDEQLRNIYVQL